MKMFACSDGCGCDTIESMDRKKTILRQMSDYQDDGWVPGTPAERIGLVWPLTREVVSLGRRYDAKQRLQRHLTRILRKEG